MSDTPTTPTSDYGEPWKPAFTNCFSLNAGDIRHFECGWRDRAIACVNACAGMAEPAKEIDAMRDQIKNSAINTNVRLFDLVRYMMAKLHEEQLITDSEYAWLCGGSDMANSPKGGSPSPRRLEDYDAMRDAIREAGTLFDDFSKACNHKDNTANAVQLEWIVSKSGAVLAKLQPVITP